MAAKLTFYPVGCGDSTLIDLANGKKMLVDFDNNNRNGDPYSANIDLADELGKNLRAAGRDYIDVVVFTHIDKDHINGFADFFHLDHAAKYQGNGRIKIETLWVPAAAITEEGITDEQRILRSEARYRLKEGKGIRVFSRPDRLKDWLAANGLSLESRQHLITDAGTFVPGFSKHGPDGVDIFVHSPFGWRMNATQVEARNEDSICFQATFLEGAQHTRVLFFGDTTQEILSEIVKVTKYHHREGQLEWDIYKTPHHSSYLSIGPEKGVDETVPNDEVRWLLEENGHAGGILVSSCPPIPIKGTAKDIESYPPHRQAHAYYRRVATKWGGEIRVTMQFPNESKPRPSVIEITALGATLVMAVANAAAASDGVTERPVRAGSR